MDFVDEENVVLLEVGEHPGKIASTFDDRAGGDAHFGSHLLTNDMSEGCFAESGRAAEENMVEGFPALFGRTGHDLNPFNRFRLTGKIAEGGWAEGCIERGIP